jgi:nitrate/TMAO reductase-like tetraheme cytochrome c subunit
MGRPILRGIIPVKIPLHLSFLILALGIVVGFLSSTPGFSEAVVQPGLENSCINCHQSLPDKRLSQPVQQWSESVHAEVGNTCEGCHGGDPKEASLKAMSKASNFSGVPEDDEIATFCGKCHQGISKDYLDSPHGMSGEPTCKDCHGAHTIQRSSEQIISEEKCSVCHDYEYPEKLKGILQSLHSQFQEAENKVKLINGFPTDPLEKDLKKDWKDLRQVRRVLHQFDITAIQAKAKDVTAEITETTLEVDRLIGLSQARRKWGLLVVLVFMGLAVLTYLYNKAES